MAFLGFGKKKEVAPEEKKEDPEAVGDLYYFKSPKRLTRLSEAAGFAFPNPDSGTEFDDQFFKKFGAENTADLPAELLQKIQRLSMLLHRKNVRAKRAIELVIDFVLGEGFMVKAVDDSVQRVLDRHLEVNHWDTKADERLRSLAIYGEQVYPAVIHPDGLVQISSIDPLNVQKVTRQKGNPAELEKVLFVRRTKRSDQDILPLDIIKRDVHGKFNLAAPGARPKSCFYFTANRVDGGSRGVPDLTASMDWMEGLDGFIFSVMERAAISQDVVYDLEIQGADRNKIRQETDDFIRAIRSGGAWGHNEKMQLKLLVPQLAADDSEKAASMLIKQIQAGTALAGLFYGDSEDLTRASASEISLPVGKMIGRRQAFFRGMLNQMLAYQIQASQAHGKLKADVDTRFEVQLPQVMLRDVSQITQALVQLTTAMDTAEQKGWVSSAQASKVFRMVMEQLSVDTGDAPPIESSGMGGDVDEVLDMMDRENGNN